MYFSISVSQHFSLFSYNIRDMFEVFQDERDPARMQNLISRGWKIRDVLEKLSTIEELNTIMKEQNEEKTKVEM